MRGLGTVLNVAAILVGAGLGVLIGHRLPERTRRTVTDALGLVTLVIGGLNVAALRDAHARGQGRVEFPGAPRPLVATISARGLHVLGEPLARDRDATACVAWSLTRVSSYL